MSSKSVVLIISPVASHPPLGGNLQRVNEVACAVRQLGYDPFFLYYPLKRKGCTPEEREALRNFWGDRHYVAGIQDFGMNWRHRLLSSSKYWLSRFRLSKRLPRLINWLHDCLMHEDAYVPPKMVEWVQGFVEREKPVACICEYFHFTRVYEALDAGIRKVVDTHDVFTDRNHRISHELGQLHCWYSLTREQEKRTLSRANAVLAIQGHEKQHFDDLLPREMEVLTVDHLTRPVSLERSLGEAEVLGYLGSANTINLNGLRWFLEKCWPQIQSRVPQAKLVIAGTICRSLEDGPYEKLGLIDDLKDFYSVVDFTINPVFSGSGLKIKTAQSMTYAVPVVSTDIGLHGMESGIGHGLFRANAADEMIGVCVKLLNDPSEISKASDALKTHYCMILERSLSGLRRALLVD